ncbi:MAG TPA: IMP dehydrogenase [Phycisphaerales bacterium]|nr:IMP dehydrogenase [Phycisphaerales bacterium]
MIEEGITFDDVLLIPRYSNITPDRADTSAQLTKSIRLNVPFLSAPMDTVTESALAIALAQEGGVGIIHKNLSPEAQAREVAKVKRSENGVITDPVTLAPADTVARAKQLMVEQNVSGFPVTHDGSSHGRVVGILTKRDMKFVNGADSKVGDVMTRENLVTAPPDTTLDRAEGILSSARVEKLLLVYGPEGRNGSGSKDGAREGGLAGLITMRDIDNLRAHRSACRDARGRLRVGAAVGVHQHERVEMLLEAEVDLIIVDTAHGHSENVLATVREIKKRHNIEVVAGNIATADAATDLIKAGVDALKVGIGPGSICTTRVVTGVGMPQLTAIFNVSKVADKSNIPVIADGGIRQSGDISKAIAAGASCVMLGSLFAGLDESPGELILHQGRRYKSYRGMGSAGAMGAGSADRYSQANVSETRKFVPEGVEGRVPYRGSLVELVYQMNGGLRAAMGYCGCATIADLRAHGRFVRVSHASLIESHPHDIQITKESPNYAVPGYDHRS